MGRKTWHKQLHRRKIWKTYSLRQKMKYYMKPFIKHLRIVWLQGLPTILKIVYSLCLLVIIMLPVIYLAAIILVTYWIIQFIGQRHFGLVFPYKLDLHRFVERLRNTDPTGKYQYDLYNLGHRFNVLTGLLTSLIDYIQLATNYYGM